MSKKVAMTIYGNWQHALDHAFRTEIMLYNLFCEAKGDDNAIAAEAEELLERMTRVRKRIKRVVEYLEPDYRSTLE